MNTKFNVISSILIIFLSVLLVVIVVGYYNKPIVVKNSDSYNGIVSSNHELQNPSDNESSGEKEVANSSGEMLKNVEPTESGEKITEEIKKEQEDNPFFDNPKTVIMTSEDTMTNKEKREILNELDGVLMELLDVVDKVQTVDETRLINEEGEVQ